MHKLFIASKSSQRHISATFATISKMNINKDERTILLEPGNRILWVFMALIFFINGIIHLANEQIEWYYLILGIAMIALSISQAFYAIHAYSEISRYSPKVRVNKKIIELKNSFRKRTHSINWSDIKLIHFASYKVEFDLNNETKVALPYNIKLKKYKELKRILREIAEPQNIQIIGGYH